jgi:uncharacterized protein YjdB
MKRLVAVLVPIALLAALAACDLGSEGLPKDQETSLHLFDAMASKEVTDTTITMKVGDTIQLAAKYVQAASTVVTDSTEFTSSAPAAASVTNEALRKGEIQANAAGDAVITGDFKNPNGDHFTAKVTVHVNP